jgi:hypothetical protein
LAADIINQLPDLELVVAHGLLLANEDNARRLVLALLGAKERFRIDVLQAEEDEGSAGARRLLDEIRNPVAERVNLQDQLDAEFIAFAATRSAGRGYLPNCEVAE